MELQQLRYVVAIAEERHFTRAADRCFVAQSALSHQVAKLERELGVDLFARNSRRVEVTAAGEAFLPWARTCLEAAERASSEALATSGVVGGTLRLGLIPTVTALDVPGLVARLRREHPRVTVLLQVGGSDALQEGVRSGRLDLAVIGIAAGLEPEGVSSRLLAEESLAAVVPARHRLARRARVRLADLADDDFADFPVGSPGREQSDRAFRAAGLHRNVPYEGSTPHLIGSIVAAGLAVALLPRAFAPAEGVRLVDVTDGPRRVEHLVWSALRPPPAAQAAIELALDAPDGGWNSP